MWQLVIANRGKRVIAFTHKPVLPDTVAAHRNRCVIAVGNTAGFTINLSANNPAEADALAGIGIGPVVTILAHDYARRAVRHRAKTRPMFRLMRSTHSLRLTKFSLVAVAPVWLSSGIGYRITPATLSCPHWV